MLALLINDWRLGLAALVVLPPAIVLSRWFQHTSTRAQLEVRTRIAAVTAHVAESVAGMAVVQTFQRQQSLFRVALRRAQRRQPASPTSTRSGSSRCSSRRSSCSASSRRSRCSPSAPTSFRLTQIGTLAAAYFLLSLAFQPLQSLSEVYSQLQSGQAAMAKISLVLDEEPDIRQPRAPAADRPPRG